MNRVKISFTLITFIIGFMIAIQFQSVKEPIVRDTRDAWELRETLKNEMVLQSKLLDGIRLHDEKINHYKSEKEESKEEILKQTIQELKKEAGLTEVKGTGITLTIAPISEVQILGQTLQSVSPVILQRLVNELNIYGAKHISIDGERYINTTVIRDINGVTKVGTHSLNTFPFEIKVITENMEMAEKMYNSMQISPSIDDFFVDNLEVAVSKPEQNVVVPAHVESIHVRNMEPAVEQGDS